MMNAKCWSVGLILLLGLSLAGSLIDNIVHTFDDVTGFTVEYGTGTIYADTTDKQEGVGSCRGEITTDVLGYAVIKTNTGLAKSMSSRSQVFIWVKSSLKPLSTVVVTFYDGNGKVCEYDYHPSDGLPTNDTWAFMSRDLDSPDVKDAGFDESNIDYVYLTGFFGIANGNTPIKIWFDLLRFDPSAPASLISLVRSNYYVAFTLISIIPIALCFTLILTLIKGRESLNAQDMSIMFGLIVTIIISFIIVMAVMNAVIGA